MWIDTTQAEDLAFVRRHWRDAPPDVAAIDETLEASQPGCEAYAPAPALDPVTALPVIPPAWRLALVYQARDTRAAAMRDGGMIAGEVYAIRPRPLSDAVKQLLRPARGRRAIG